MKKFILTISTTLLFVLYIFYEHSNTQQTVTVSPSANTISVNTTTDNQTSAATSTTAKKLETITSTSAPKSTTSAASVKIAGAYSDGTYTGDSVDAYYGNVQVQAIISNGKIVDIKFLSYPNDRKTSAQISAKATPVLISEAIAAQNAKVDVVSGATETSQAFKQSLASALVKAKS